MPSTNSTTYAGYIAHAEATNYAVFAEGTYGLTDALDVIAHYGKAMQEGMHKVLTKRGIPHSFTGHYSMSGLFFSAEAPTTYRNWKLSDYTFYDTMAAEKLYPKGMDYKRAFDLSFIRQTVQNFE